MVIDQVVTNVKSECFPSTSVPACQECDTGGKFRLSVHSYNGPYFCIKCCNYIDEHGKAL